MDWRDYIERIPGIACGKPKFKETRLTVEFVLERLADGESPELLLKEYEVLRPEHIPAALAYAAAMIRNDELISAT